MSDEKLYPRSFDEPWNLPPVPSWCSTGLILWAQETPEERKAQWMRQPRSWHDTFGRERIEYWRSRTS